MKYLLIENCEACGKGSYYTHQNIIVKYFEDLVNLHSYICHELMYGDLDMEDFKSKYDGVEERIDEHGSSYYIFEGEKELISLQIGNLEYGDWDRFEDFCLNVKESKIVNFYRFDKHSKMTNTPLIYK